MKLKEKWAKAFAEYKCAGIKDEELKWVIKEFTRQTFIEGFDLFRNELLFNGRHDIPGSVKLIIENVGEGETNDSGHREAPEELQQHGSPPKEPA